MRIGTQASRIRRTRIVMASAVEVILAATAAIFLEGGVLGFVAAYLGIVAFDIVRWLLRSAIGGMIFRLFDRRAVADQMLTTLRRDRYPRPGDYVESPMVYLRNVSEDEAAPMPARLSAAVDLGRLEAWSGFINYGVKSRWEIALEDALMAYDKECEAREYARADDVNG